MLLLAPTNSSCQHQLASRLNFVLTLRRAGGRGQLVALVGDGRDPTGSRHPWGGQGHVVVGCFCCAHAKASRTSLSHVYECKAAR